MKKLSISVTTQPVLIIVLDGKNKKNINTKYYMKNPFPPPEQIDKNLVR